MSSYISSFDAAAASPWRRFLWVYFATLLAVGGTCIALVVAIDPYNTGMLTPFDKAIVQTYDAPRFGNAGRGRDPQFDSAIIGNSTAQLLEPERLDRLVGGRFVNLIVSGSGPVEQIVTLEYFLRHHPGNVRTIIVAMDMGWCYPDRKFSRDELLHPFPFWLYEGNRLNYAAHVATIEGIGLSLRKVMMLLGRREPRSRADGYDNFELGRMWKIDDAWKRLGAEGRMQWMTEADMPAIDHFAALDALDRVIAGLPKQARVVLLFTPYFHGALPESSWPTARRIEGCKARTAQIADMRHGAYRDFFRDDAMTREAANFWDSMHYRNHIARLIENEIGAAVKAIPAAH